MGSCLMSGCSCIKIDVGIVTIGTDVGTHADTLAEPAISIGKRVVGLAVSSGGAETIFVSFWFLPPLGDGTN